MIQLLSEILEKKPPLRQRNILSNIVYDIMTLQIDHTHAECYKPEHNSILFKYVYAWCAQIVKYGEGGGVSITIRHARLAINQKNSRVNKYLTRVIPMDSIYTRKYFSVHI